MGKFQIYSISILGVLFVASGCDSKSSVTSLTTPVVNLETPTISSSQTAMDSSATATLNVYFTNLDTNLLTAGTGNSGAPPAGLTTLVEGTAYCSQVALLSPNLLGAEVQVSGCTGDGSVAIQVNANVISTESTTFNSASSQQVITVQNTLPVVSSIVATNTTATTSGANTITVTFNELVQDLSTSNSGGEFTITGCTTTNPTATVVTSNDGNGHSIATATLSGGTCTTADSVHVSIDVTKVKSQSGDSGTSASNSVTYTIL